MLNRDQYLEIIKTCEIKGQTKTIVNVLRYLELGYPVLLYGPPGTGKTTIAEHILSKIKGKDSYIKIEATESMTEYNLIGGFHPLSLSQSVDKPIYKYGAITRAIKQGKNIIIDEFNRAPSSAYSGLFMLLSTGTLPLEYEEKVLEKPKDLKLIITANINDEGTFKLSSALKRRFIPIYVPYISQNIEKQVVLTRTELKDEQLINKILEFAKKTRQAFLEDKMLPQALSTDGVIKMARYCALSIKQGTDKKTAFLDSAFSQALVIADENDENSMSLVKQIALEISSKM